MPEESLKALFAGLTSVIAILSGHYQSMIFDTKTDVFFIGNMIEKCREVLNEASETLESKKKIGLKL